MKFRRLSLVLPLACVLWATPGPASADWHFGAYTGAASTVSNTLTVTPAAGATATLPDVTYRGESLDAPIYYGYRVGWMPGDRGLGVEFEFTHAKAIAIATGSTELTDFRQSHGLNLALGNAAYRLPVCGRCILGVRFGAGVAIPHVESTFRGAHQEQYQYGGMAWQAGAGIEYRLWHQLYGLADARFSRVSEEHLRGAGTEIGGAFATRHVSFGLGWRLPGN